MPVGTGFGAVVEKQEQNPDKGEQEPPLKWRPCLARCKRTAAAPT